MPSASPYTRFGSVLNPDPPSCPITKSKRPVKVSTVGTVKKSHAVIAS
jgi:hypothetical protein